MFQEASGTLKTVINRFTASFRCIPRSSGMETPQRKGNRDKLYSTVTHKYVCVLLFFSRFGETDSPNNTIKFILAFHSLSLGSFRPPLNNF